MAHVSTYLNFPGTAEKAFNHYRTVFGTEFVGDGFMRFGDMPSTEGPPVPDDVKEMIVHVALPTLGDHQIMGTDAVEHFGQKVVQGNNIHVSLHPDSRAETDRLFAALSEGGRVSMPLQEMFWGDYYGSCVDRFGISWMFNCAARPA